ASSTRAATSSPTSTSSRPSPACHPKQGSRALAGVMPGKGGERREDLEMILPALFAFLFAPLREAPGSPLNVDGDYLSWTRTATTVFLSTGDTVSDTPEPAVRSPSLPPSTRTSFARLSVFSTNWPSSLTVNVMVLALVSTPLSVPLMLTPWTVTARAVLR